MRSKIAHLKRSHLKRSHLIVTAAVIMLSGCNEIKFDDGSKSGHVVVSGRATIPVENPGSNQNGIDTLEITGHATQPGATVRLMALDYDVSDTIAGVNEYVEIASTTSSDVPLESFSNFGLELYPYSVQFQPNELANSRFWPADGVACLVVDDGVSNSIRSVTTEVVVSQEAAQLLYDFNKKQAAKAKATGVEIDADVRANIDFSNNNNNDNLARVEIPSSVKAANMTTLIDVTNSIIPSTDLQFLTYKFTDPDDNTVGQPTRRRGLSNAEIRDMSDHGENYYEAIGAFRRYDVKRTNLRNGNVDEFKMDKSTLNNFKTLHGWEDDAVPIGVFYNGGDFGLGRRVSCMSKSDNINVPIPPGVDVRQPRVRTEVLNDPVAMVCISENFGSVDGDVSLRDSLNLAANLNNPPFASVTMEYMENADPNTPNAIKFYVYLNNGQRNGDLLPLAILDSEGEKHFPEICTVCHGGEYDLVTRSITGASFLPMAIPEFDYSTRSGFTRQEQEVPLRYINDLIAQAGSTPNAVRKYIEAQRKAPPFDPNAPVVEQSRAGATGSHGPIPIGWEDRPELYEKVYAPYCRACHQTSKLLPFETSASFVAFGAVIVDAVCERFTMPAAERTFANFWESDARGVMLRELGIAHPCTPQTN